MPLGLSPELSNGHSRCYDACSSAAMNQRRPLSVCYATSLLTRLDEEREPACLPRGRSWRRPKREDAMIRRLREVDGSERAAERATQIRKHDLEVY
ncbi:hypothetical protein KFL_000100670 [Klebsormidium nitens]|uniref:Uncharacterized protein n=1 Tax=Klebsormidium nitens TaxID=105231 RepID=A0A1Y1HKZ0_KLENI|nr:hypothetical protein KFL_000100670 [Klebsormidium nitens]|eukprot:GAQ78302.1 hypothetical protein KFL_000100670 [Klebsormidium nitens]